MSVSIVPFTVDHLDAAATLLAAQHRHDRTRTPNLSPAYEDPAATRPVVHDLLIADGASRRTRQLRFRVIPPESARRTFETGS